mmetsp:Transcript_93350/g.147522  ORF Transcript_93350/g.147522 Transcript_93350/m.147522 type:complete len:117 (-) Transcript_93350:505-855(-)
MNLSDCDLGPKDGTGGEEKKMRLAMRLEKQRRMETIIDVARTIVLTEIPMEIITDAVLIRVLIERPTEKLSLIGAPKEAFGTPSEKGEVPIELVIEIESAIENVLTESEIHQVEIR